MDSIAWMAWTWPTAIFFVLLACTLGVMIWLAIAYPEAERVGVLRIPTTRGDPSGVDRLRRHRPDRDLADRGRH
jgi:predicted small integral membrane protein